MVLIARIQLFARRETQTMRRMISLIRMMSIRIESMDSARMPQFDQCNSNFHGLSRAHNCCDDVIYRMRL